MLVRVSSALAPGSVVAAQARVAAGLVTAYDPPLAGPVLRKALGTPRVGETTVAGSPAIEYRPARGAGPWPAVLVVPGVTREGRRHAAFVGIGRALAATGQLAVVVQPDGLAEGELTPGAVDRVRAAVSATASRPDARGGRVALVGVSGGGSLSLLAAAHPDLAPRVSAVTALAPCCDVAEAMRVVTTEVVRVGGSLVPFTPGDFFRLAISRSLAACLEPGLNRDALRAHLASLEDYAADPLAGIRSWPRSELGVEARSLVELLSNGIPERFDELFAALPDNLRDAIRRLSPTLAAGAITAPAELVVAREDKYIPLEDARSFTRACPTARLTVIESLTHAVPRLALAEARDLARLDGALVRLLARARTQSYSRP
jgi:pimeloyl-ACP methyl ester carboxylesterase